MHWNMLAAATFTGHTLLTSREMSSFRLRPTARMGTGAGAASRSHSLFCERRRQQHATYAIRRRLPSWAARRCLRSPRAQPRVAPLTATARLRAATAARRPALPRFVVAPPAAHNATESIFGGQKPPKAKEGERSAKTGRRVAPSLREALERRHADERNA